MDGTKHPVFFPSMDGTKQSSVLPNMDGTKHPVFFQNDKFWFWFQF